MSGAARYADARQRIAILAIRIGLTLDRLAHGNSRRRYVDRRRMDRVDVIKVVRISR
jgi:hypothetical protein